MIFHSFKMIWAERKSNAWILAELIIVFSILWFCSGFIYEKGKKYFEPVGFDIKHSYLLEFGLKKGITNDNKGGQETLAQDGQTIFERIKKHPEVEVACFSLGNAYPYSTSYTTRQYLKDTISYVASVRNISPEFFDVFRIKFQKGKTFDSNEILSEKQVIISPDRKNRFYDNDILSTEYLSDKKPDPNEPLPQKRPETKEEWAQIKFIEDRYPVAGIINKMKRGDFENYERIVFSPLKSQKLSDIAGGWTFISIRVKEHADKDFPAKFMKEKKEQLKVGPFELTGVKPFNEIRKEYIKMTGDQEDIETVSVIIVFLLINVFLGIVGTFRFRTNARRGEIGLRCALGSGKNKIRQLLLGETFFMLLLASIPGTIIAINVQLTGILSKLGISFLTEQEYSSAFIKRAAGSDTSVLQLIVFSYLITFVMMLIIIWLGTWYPAKKASEVQPAEALHYE